MKKKSIGFGYNPEETKQHFLVCIPSSKKEQVIVYERYVWDEGDVQKSEMNLEDKKCRVKVMLSYDKWKAVQPTLEREFNKTLKVQGKLVGRFKIGQVPVERLLGKEMLLLLWGIEKCDMSSIEPACKNWLGLSREERWWLFTMTNANTGSYLDGDTGWRVALRFALAENPVLENNVQGSIVEYMYGKLK